MITITYAHNHDCQWKHQVVSVRPYTEAGHYFFKQVPVCTEALVELEEVSVIST